MDKTEVEARIAAFLKERDEALFTSDGWDGTDEERAVSAREILVLTTPPPAGDTGEVVALSRADAELARTVIDKMMGDTDPHEDTPALLACQALDRALSAPSRPSDAALRGRVAGLVGIRTVTGATYEVGLHFDTLENSERFLASIRARALAAEAESDRLRRRIARILDELDRQIVACDSYAEKSGRPMSDPRETWLICNSHIRDRARELRQALKEQTP